MKPTNPEDIRWETDDLNERVMENAAPSVPSIRDVIEPEVAVSDEYPMAVHPGTRVEDEATISELLVNAGSEEAALEQRVSADPLADDSEEV